MRPELQPLPERMRHLPIDVRGYPVPWFVAWIDGKPEFRAMDQAKRVKAIKDGRCWVCGGSMYKQPLAFVIGPMCGINRTTSEPPGHLECARWSALNCPFLTQREMKRREDEVTDRCPMPGIGIKRNPGVALVWITDKFEIFHDGAVSFLLRVGEPAGLEFYSHGRKALWSELTASVESGYPLLKEMAEKQEGALQELNACRDRFMEFAKEHGVYDAG